MKNKIFIGIDPAFRKNGFCICILDSSDQTIYFKTFKNGFLGFSSWFLHDSPANAVICVENSNLTKATFNMSGNKYEVARKSRNVGKNQAISQCVCDLCETKYKTFGVSPREKGKKWSKEEFNRVLYQQKHVNTKKRATNQDERDAYKLCLIAYRKRFY
jgi:hypothetical protein